MFLKIKQFTRLITNKLPNFLPSEATVFGVFFTVVLGFLYLHLF